VAASNPDDAVMIQYAEKIIECLEALEKEPMHRYAKELLKKHWWHRTKTCVENFRRYVRLGESVTTSRDEVERLADAIKNAPAERVVTYKRVQASIGGDGSDMYVTKAVTEYRVTDHSRAKAAISAMQPAAVREWMPIETLRPGVHVNLHWPAAGKAVFVGGKDKKGNLYYFSYKEGRYIKATRDVLSWKWQPLPAAPSTNANGER
jgi:hypothetical protein